MARQTTLLDPWARRQRGMTPGGSAISVSPQLATRLETAADNTLPADSVARAVCHR